MTSHTNAGRSNGLGRLGRNSTRSNRGAAPGLVVWVLASSLAMVLGALGPWATALGFSLDGIDGSDDGWMVIAVAVIGAGLFVRSPSARLAGVWPMLAGLVGLAVTIYDRHVLTGEIGEDGDLAQAVVGIGWGLNVSLIASISMAAAAIAWFWPKRLASRSFT
jgi:hypothetical protein